MPFRGRGSGSQLSRRVFAGSAGGRRHPPRVTSWRSKDSACERVILVVAHRLAWEDRAVTCSLVYLMTRRLLAFIVLLCRGDAAKVTGLLALRHENAVLRRDLPGCGSSGEGVEGVAQAWYPIAGHATSRPKP